jgi:hypothetical protein
MKTKDGAPDSSTHIFGPERTRRATLPLALSLSRQAFAVSTSRAGAGRSAQHQFPDARLRQQAFARAFLIDTNTIRNRPKLLEKCSLRFSNRHGLRAFCARSNPRTKRPATKFLSENKTGGECQRHPPPGVGGVCCRYPVRDFGVPAPGPLGKPAFSRCHVSLILITLQL